MSTLATGQAKVKKQSTESVGLPEQLGAKRSKQLGTLQASLQMGSIKGAAGDGMQTRLAGKKMSS